MNLDKQKEIFKKKIIELVNQGYSKNYIQNFYIEFEKRIKEILIQKARSDFWSFLQCMKLYNEEYEFLSLSQDWERCINKGFSEIINSKTIDRGIFNLTPRLGKTTLITELGTAFLLGREKCKIAIVNANLDKVSEINLKIKQIVNSEIYSKIFNVKDNANKNATKKLVLSNGSNAVFKVSGSNVIGSGYNYIFFDDYLNPNNERSQAKKEQAKINLSSFFSRKEYTKQSDGTFKNTKIFIIEQRLSTDDTTSICKSKWDEFNIEYIHICLPFYFESETNINGFMFPENSYVDIKFNEKVKREIIAERGQYTFETQYQQNPSCPADVIVKREWWNYYACSYQELDLLYLFITTDLAFSLKTSADYTVACCWGMGRDKKIYLIDMIRDRVEYGEAKQIFKNFYNKYKTLKAMNISWIYCKAFYIEDTTPSKPLISDLKKEISCVKTIDRNKDKYSRLSVVLPEIENGLVVLPANKEFSSKLIQEAYEFRKDDNHKHDDIVDNLIDCITQELKTNSSFAGYKDLANAFARNY